MLATEALAFRSGGAACHSARFLPSATVLEAMLGSWLCVGGASWSCALSMRTVLGAEATLFGKRFAAFHCARLLAAAAMPGAPSFARNCSLAVDERAEPPGSVLLAEPTL